MIERKFQVGEAVIFRCPDRCDTWQLGTVIMIAPSAVIIDPDDDQCYTYHKNKVYMFTDDDYSLSILAWTYTRQVELIGKDTIYKDEKERT